MDSTKATAEKFTTNPDDSVRTVNTMEPQHKNVSYNPFSANIPETAVDNALDRYCRDLAKTGKEEEPISGSGCSPSSYKGFEIAIEVSATQSHVTFVENPCTSRYQASGVPSELRQESCTVRQPQQINFQNDSVPLFKSANLFSSKCVRSPENLKNKGWTESALEIGEGPSPAKQPRRDEAKDNCEVSFLTDHPQQLHLPGKPLLVPAPAVVVEMEDPVPAPPPEPSNNGDPPQVDDENQGEDVHEPVAARHTGNRTGDSPFMRNPIQFTLPRISRKMNIIFIVYSIVSLSFIVSIYRTDSSGTVFGVSGLVILMAGAIGFLVYYLCYS